MNAAPINSRALTAYSLPKPARRALEQFDKMRQYMLRGGAAMPDAISLHRSDFVAIDDAVRRQSCGAFNARTVTWGGFHLRIAGEPAPTLQLSADA